MTRFGRSSLPEAPVWLAATVLLIITSITFLSPSRDLAPNNHTFSNALPPTQTLAPSTLLPRANDANNGIKGWLGYDPSVLNRPIDQLDDKGQAVKEGYGLLCMMRKALGAIAPSRFQDINDIEKFGWRTTFVDHKDGDFVKDLGLDKAFRDLRIPFSGWTQMGLGNFASVPAPTDRTKILHPASQAVYSSEINLQAGAIVATQSYGPEWMAERYEVELEEGQSLTPLQRVSDLLFLGCRKRIAETASGSLTNLEHMFRWNTFVPEVQAHLKMVAGGMGIEQIGEWPGVSYPTSELQALATLSAPNARGVAWLLGQHKQAMGVKAIDRVNIFNCPADDGQAHWCVYLHIVPV